MQELPSGYLSALALSRLLKQANNYKKLVFFIGLSQSISGPPYLSGSPQIYLFTFKPSTM